MSAPAQQKHRICLSSSPEVGEAGYVSFAGPWDCLAEGAYAYQRYQLAAGGAFDVAVGEEACR